MGLNLYRRDFLDILSAQNLSVYYDSKCVLNDISFAIKEREIVFITGESGSGKSTLLTCLNGFLADNGGRYEGELKFMGCEIGRVGLANLRRQINMLFQDSRPFPFSVRQNLSYVSEFFNGKKLSDERAYELLRAVNLDTQVVLNDDAMRLSGGQKQRLCIARMLSAEPKVLIFDEPSSSLDVQNTRVIEELFVKLSARYTIIISTHDIDMARRIGMRNLHIQDGGLIEKPLV